MSWGINKAGNPAKVADAVKADSYVPDAVKNCVQSFADSAQEGSVLIVEGGGHTDTSGYGSASLNIKVWKETK